MQEKIVVLHLTLRLRYHTALGYYRNRTLHIGHGGNRADGHTENCGVAKQVNQEFLGCGRQ